MHMHFRRRLMVDKSSSSGSFVSKFGDSGTFGVRAPKMLINVGPRRPLLHLASL
jgi:hypothetical protein